MTKQQFYLRVHQTEKEFMVSACDADLLGETLSEDELDLCVSERFFGGELVPIDTCLEALKKASSFNIIGSAIVKAAIDERLVNEISVKWIECKDHGKVGHAMLLR